MVVWPLWKALKKQEEEQFYRELGSIDKKGTEAIMQITTSWYEKSRAEGLAEGMEKGKIEGKQDVICKFMARKFGVKIK